MRGKMSCVIKVILIAAVLGVSSAQNIYSCPDSWYTNTGFCYKFEGDLPQNYDKARDKCNIQGAGVLSVESQAEDSFIKRWLQTNDPSDRSWYTSGVRARKPEEIGAEFIWESTGGIVENVLNSTWLEFPLPTMTDGVIIYSYGATGIGWKFADPSVKRPYICKISERESYRILRTHRSFDYGLEAENSKNPERGPYFLVKPHSTVVVSRYESRYEPVSLECVVQANPLPTYKWFRGENLETEVTTDLDKRYTITNGKLTIEEPVESLDKNQYRCEASNKYGKVISNTVEIAFGSLGEFNNVQDDGTIADAYNGASIECSKISFSPAITYQWIKGDSLHAVRTEFQDHIFISNNGKLFFSEVTTHDTDQYRCVAALTGVNRFTIGTDQPPMRTSLPIPLRVAKKAPKADWGPEIQDDFIAVFPKPPLRGHNIRMECFAYGSMTNPFFYSWSRDDKPMPESARMSDNNRVLTIFNAQLEDSGIYRCTVSRGLQFGDSKVIDLDLGARPFFVSPLRDQHADIDSQLTWICNAEGKPDPVYRWYKNGKVLTTDVNTRVRVQNNVLTISSLDSDMHNGMYQCGATNEHGETLSNAQLRVLAFAPIMSKYPPPKRIMASEGGNLTVSCMPEAAPTPTIEWFKGSSKLTTDGSKYTIFANGNLYITSMGVSDVGTYSCKATNLYGEASVSTTIDISQGGKITMAPIDQVVVVNDTVFMRCEASYPKDVDMIYEWTFNGFPLEFTQPFYRQVQNGKPGSNGLYVIGAQFKHEGRYFCTAKTPFNSESQSAYLTVNGPPKQPAGVYVISESVTKNSTEVRWTAGSSSGGIVTFHFVQVANVFKPNTWNDFLRIRVSDSLLESKPAHSRHAATVVGLNPGTGYRFRVIAQNEYGRGQPSDPSPYIQTYSAAPVVFPRNLRGGGGSVGLLIIRWDPLHRSEWGDKYVSYRVFWRNKDDNVDEGLWRVQTVNGPYQDMAVELVGGDLFYLPYEVKIQAFNTIGNGPNSSVEIVYSAENLPIGTPQNVQSTTFNSTAIHVTWIPVPNTRKAVRGKIVGYQINYWREGDNKDIWMQSVRYYGQISEGLVIGLEPNYNWLVDVQVYNSAGLGPRSNYFLRETSGYAPLTYPQEVRVSSMGRSRVRVLWRGISLTVNEEALTGYAIWLWTASESFRTAKLIEIPGSVYTYVIKDIEDNRLYAMRISAVGGGGYGVKTPPVYFTTEGQILIDSNFARTIEIFKSGGTTIKTPVTLMALCLLSLLYLTSYI